MLKGLQYSQHLPSAIRIDVKFGWAIASTALRPDAERTCQHGANLDRRAPTLPGDQRRVVHFSTVARRPIHSRTVASMRPPVARQSCPSDAPAGQ